MVCATAITGISALLPLLRHSVWNAGSAASAGVASACMSFLRWTSSWRSTVATTVNPGLSRDVSTMPSSPRSCCQASSKCHGGDGRPCSCGDVGMKLIAFMWTIPIALCLSGASLADDLTTSGDPKSLGFSAARLARIAPWYQARFDSFSPSDGLVPGAVVAIAKGGKLAYLQAIGFQDRAKTIPMKTNSIFWIASMSKPVTSVAAMILVDDGKLDLDAPVSRYLPELKDMRVAFQKTDPATGKTEYGLGLPQRPMAVRDLLRHTSGLIYADMDFAYPERGLADATADSVIRAIHKLYGWRAVWRRDKTLADFVSSLAGLPLAHQPGEVHEYGWSIEGLSRVVEGGSRQSF